MAMSGSLTVFHGSDFQCGAPFLPAAADAMLRLARSVAPDLVVISGDLTQRAKAREFRQARGTLDGFGDVPLVITPGNHDVPLYRVWERITAPYRQWTRFAGSALDTVTRIPGATVVALNSAAPRRAIVNGRLHEHQLDFARAAFETGEADDLRIVVTHHHFVPVPDGLGGRPLPGATGIARAFETLGVDVVLGGHVHQNHMTDSGVLTGSGPDHAVPLIAAGTATSSRGRGAETNGNSLCVLRISEEALEATPYRRASSAADFEATEPVVWPRHRTTERAR